MSNKRPPLDLPDLTSDGVMRLAYENLSMQHECLVKLGAEVQIAAANAEDKPSKYQGLCQAYGRQYQVVAQAQEEVDRLEFARSEAGRWEARARDLEAALTEEYGDRGPQYDILIKRAVAAEVRAEMLERSGRGVKSLEYSEAASAVLRAIQGLQRYTESQKTEQIQVAQEKAMVVIIEMAERIIAPKHPETWEIFVHEIDNNLPNGMRLGLAG